MNDNSLEAVLGALLRVDDRALDRLARRVSRARRRWWWRWGGAAALALIAATVWWGGFGAGATDRDGAWVLDLQRRDDGTARDYDEPPPFGDAAARADWLLWGTVVSVSTDAVAFEVHEVLVGPAVDPVVRLSRAFDEMVVSCRHDLTWQPGEDLVLALFRDPDDGVVKVSEGGSGQGRLPLLGVATMDDLRVALRDGVLPASRLAAHVRAHGPGAIVALRTALGGLLQRGVDAQAPAVQQALVDALQGGQSAPATEGARRARRAALRELTEERLAALPAELRAAMLEDDLQLAIAATSPHTLVALLRPYALAGEVGAFEPLRACAREVDAASRAKPDAYGYRMLLVELLDLLWRFDVEMAQRLSWDLYARSPARGQADAGEVLAVPLRHGDPRALAELLERSEAAVDAGEVVWLDLLVTRTEPEAVAVLRRAFADPRANLIFNRYDHSPTRALQALGAAAARRLLAPVRDLLVERLRDAELDTVSYRDWFELYRLGFDDITPFAAALAAQLRRVERPALHELSLVRGVEDALQHRALEFAHPTAPELQRAAARLASMLE